MNFIMRLILEPRQPKFSHRRVRFTDDSVSYARTGILSLDNTLSLSSLNLVRET